MDVTVVYLLWRFECIRMGILEVQTVVPLTCPRRSLSVRMCVNGRIHLTQLRFVNLLVDGNDMKCLEGLFVDCDVYI